MPNEQKIDKIKRGKPFSLIDLIIISLALILAGCFVVYSCATKEAGGGVRITQTGKETKTYSIDKDATIEIECKDGIIIVVIDGANKSVRVESSPCRDKICMHRGTIKYTGDSIICLPQEVFIKITGKEEWYPIG